MPATSRTGLDRLAVAGGYSDAADATPLVDDMLMTSALPKLALINQGLAALGSALRVSSLRCGLLRAYLGLTLSVR